MSTLIIVPTRQRASRCEKMLLSFYATRGAFWTEPFCYVDQDDPQRHEYEEIFRALSVHHEFGPKRTMVEAVNHVSENHEADFYGVLNDDHLCHTIGWDIKLQAEIDANGGTGMACGICENRERLPQIILISRDCIRDLGWYMPPFLVHQYVDNVQADLYGSAGLRYDVPDVFIEHLHPDFGKAEMDSTYQIMRSAHDRDREAYQRWKTDGGFDSDLAKLIGLKK